MAFGQITLPSAYIRNHGLMHRHAVGLCKKTGSVNMRTPCIDMHNIETLSQMQN